MLNNLPTCPVVASVDEAVGKSDPLYTVGENVMV